MTCTMVLAVVLATALQTLPAPASSRTALERLSEARPNVRWETKRVLRADFDCDGRTDQAFLGRYGGRVYVGVVRAAAEKPEILDFAVDAAIQEAICAEPAKLAIESLNYDPTDGVGPIDGFHRSHTCKGLELSGGECDSIHLFWNHASKSLDWWRE
jgi:hypothetical protein